jgi:HlyD family secretion protein
MKSKRTFWIFVAGGVLVIAIGAYLVFGKSTDKITYRFERVDRGDIEVAISATGTLSADTTVQVGSQVSGTISRLYADFNTVVQRGQLLAQLDPTSLQANVNDMKAQMDRAQATLNDAERTLKRTKDLFAKNLVAQSDYDAALTAEETAKASLESAKAQYDRAIINLKYATITSPIGGVVISRNVDVGQTVAASLQAPTLYTIANDLRKMQVQAAIDEADIGNVRQGQKVTFHVDAYPDETFEGTVSQVRLQPTITQNVVNYTVIIDVANPQLRLMPGMTATVSILVNKRDNVIRVPILATRFVPPGAQQMSMDAAAPQPSMDDSSSHSAGDHQGAPGQQGAWRRGGERPHGQGNREGGARRPEQSSVNPIAQPPVPIQVARARVWVMRHGKPAPIMVERGLQNARYVEIVQGDLKPGDEVIVGAFGQEMNNESGRTPFGPQRMGGPRGRF